MAYSKIEKSTLDIVEPIASEVGYLVYDVEYIREGPHWFLRIYIDHDDVVSLDDCEKISRLVSEKLDSTNIIPNNYFLEVSSPGIQRVLRQDWHYDAVIGLNINAKLFKAVEGAKKIEGELVAHTDEEIIIRTPEKDITVLTQNISKAHVVFDF